MSEKYDEVNGGFKYAPAGTEAGDELPDSLLREKGLEVERGARVLVEAAQRYDGATSYPNPHRYKPEELAEIVESLKVHP